VIGPQLTLAGRVPVPSSLAWFAVVITVVFFGPRPEAAPLSLEAVPPTDRTLSVNDFNTRSLVLDLLEDVAIDATGLVFNPVQAEGSLGRDISQQLIRDLRTRAIHFGTDAPAVFHADSDLLDTPVLFALASAQRVDVGPSSLVSLATGRNPNALELYASSVAASVPRISGSLSSPLDERAASPSPLNDATPALALSAGDEGSTAIAEPAILVLLAAGLAGLARQARAARRL
jgi:hypothetical protein